jgi:hypothetical protein
MGNFAEVARLAVMGMVAAGVITALFQKDRQTVAGIKAVSDGFNRAWYTSISGRK